MRFDLNKSFLDKLTRVVLAVDTPFDIIKKAYDLTNLIELKDKYGREYKIREDLLVRFSAVKTLVKLQVEFKLQRDKEKFSDHFTELNEFEKQIKKYVEEQEVISVSGDDIRYIESTINTKLKYNVINSQAGKIIDFLQDFRDDSNSLNIEEMVGEYSDLIARTNSDFIRLKNSYDDKKKSFSMGSPEKLGEVLGDYRRALNNKSRYVKTGLKWMNDTFGGWEKDRFYLLIAASGRGKSVLLLNSAIWAVKYNNYEDVVKLGKKPVVLYMTLENTVVETVMRTMGYVGGRELTKGFEKGTISEEDARKRMMADLVNKKYPDSSAELRIEYRNKGTQTMEDINKIIDDIEADGKHKVVFTAIDYIESIRSNYIKQDDVRMGLSELGKDMSNLAKDREIPVVSAMQLNRDATQKIEDGADDLDKYLGSVRSLGASHIAESLKLIQLVDVAIVIDKRKGSEPGAADTLAFRIVKSRVELNGMAPTRLHIHDFVKDNGMKMIEDIYDSTSSSIMVIPNDQHNTQSGPSAPRLQPRR